VTRLVLLHGFTGSPRSFEPLLAELASRLRGLVVLRPALLGHDRARSSASRFEQEVDRLAGHILREGFSGAHLCGYSLGARMALGLLARYAFAFRGATLIGVHPGLGDPAERAARAGRDERWCELLARRGVRAFSRAWQEQPLFASQARLTLERLAAQRAVRESQSAAGLMRSLRVTGLGQMPDYRGTLATLRMPVQLVVGAEDAKFSQLAREIVQICPPATLDVVPGVGHNVPLEAPGELSHVLTRALEDPA
jgi:2-succinyl-6-hydroxy-2,4-cyclohexadiene-1-carboxylate synthase